MLKINLYSIKTKYSNKLYLLNKYLLLFTTGFTPFHCHRKLGNNGIGDYSARFGAPKQH